MTPDTSSRSLTVLAPSESAPLLQDLGPCILSPKNKPLWEALSLCPKLS